MQVCINCGVELDKEMKECPLCGSSAIPEHQIRAKTSPSVSKMNVKKKPIAPEEKYLLQRIIWQVTSILLLSGIVATLIIDASIHKKITWSVYPISICIILFSYASVLALWHTRIVKQLVVGWLLSTGVLALLNVLLPGNEWTMRLALPILFLTNVICILLILIIKSVKNRGLNVFAFTTVSIAVYCLGLEGLISLYTKSALQLQWSIIVAACLLPVTAALLFMFFRTKDNADLQKIFHT